MINVAFQRLVVSLQWHDNDMLQTIHEEMREKNISSHVHCRSFSQEWLIDRFPCVNDDGEL